MVYEKEGLNEMNIEKKVNILAWSCIVLILMVVVCFSEISSLKEKTEAEFTARYGTRIYNHEREFLLIKEVFEEFGITYGISNPSSTYYKHDYFKFGGTEWMFGSTRISEIIENCTGE